MKRFAVLALVAAFGLTAVPASAQNQATALNDQSMVQTLKGLGYQPQALPVSGAPMFQFSANMPWGGQLPMLVEMLRNNQGQYTGYILSAILTEPLSGGLDAGKMQGLLKANYDALPCSFAIRKDGRLILQMDRPFTSVAAQYLKGDIDFLVGQLAKTREFWASHVTASAPANNVVAPVNNGPVGPINNGPINVGPTGPTGPTGPVGPISVQPAPVQFAPVTAVAGLANTVWKGSENLSGYGALEFRFFGNGEAVMVDAQSTVKGTYTVQGSTVTINLPGVATYVGTINGNTFSGQGQDAKGTWSFSVSK